VEPTDPLAWLRALRAQLAALADEAEERRSELRAEVRAEVRRLKAAGWSDQRIADAFLVTRSAVMQWRENPPDGHGG
jgi:hypothetical protein